MLILLYVAFSHPTLHYIQYFDETIHQRYFNGFINAYTYVRTLSVWIGIYTYPSNLLL